jgi:peptidoglycan hydrolase-like protein with peptidoglycan-binding domain
MKNHISVVALLLCTIMPGVVSAEVLADIDPQGQMTACPSIQNNLRYQSRDNLTNGEVSLFQDFLQSQGYLSSEPTGYFGLLTLQAAKKFQSANGISPTGYIGSITRAKIASMGGCGVSDKNTSTVAPTTEAVSQVVKDLIIKSVGSPANPESSFYPGDKVTIVGSNLPASASVYIGSTAIQVQSNANGSNITFYAPATIAPGTYNLYVVGKATQSNMVQVKVMSKKTSQGEPYISSIYPASVPADGKTSVTISGSDLSSASVYMVGKAADLSVSPSAITYAPSGNSMSFVIPVGTVATTYDVIVRGKASESNKSSLIVTSSPDQNRKPMVTMVRGKAADEFEAYAGEEVSIEGNYFGSNMSVYFGNTKATIKQSGGTLLLVTTPDLSSGTYELTVSNEKGVSSPVKVKVQGKKSVTPTVSYVQAPAENKNILYSNQRATVYGSNFSGTVYIKLVGKAQDYRVQAYNIYSGSVDFIVPIVSSVGDFDLTVEQSSVSSNLIRVQVVK